MNIVHEAWKEATKPEPGKTFRFLLYLKGGITVFGAPHKVDPGSSVIRMDEIFTRIGDMEESYRPVIVLVSEVAAVSIVYL